MRKKSDILVPINGYKGKQLTNVQLDSNKTIELLKNNFIKNKLHIVIHNAVYKNLISFEAKANLAYKIASEFTKNTDLKFEIVDKYSDKKYIHIIINSSKCEEEDFELVFYKFVFNTEDLSFELMFCDNDYYWSVA